MKNLFKSFLFISALLIMVAVVVTLFVKFGYPFLASYVGDDYTDYQAVFLDNGQVYFGRLAKLNSDFVDLKNVFYIVTDSNKKPMLVELGTAEIYGPQNYVRLNRDKIIMIQSLKSDSQVVTAVRDYYKNKSK